jgi:hypothetical protein
LSVTKEVHFRLRQSTVDKLKAMLDDSPHRSLAALADDILGRELDRLVREREADGESTH